MRCYTMDSTKMGYASTIRESYKEISDFLGHITPCEYLSDYIFKFTTYDNEIAELFVTKALEVCQAISKRKTFEYIETPENYRWFVIMCNMPFFSCRIEWGTSVRGCWWVGDTMLETTGIFIGGEQVSEIFFKEADWGKFLDAIRKFLDSYNG